MSLEPKSSNYRFAPIHDWAVIELEQSIGNITGFIDIDQKFKSSKEGNTTIIIAGYPSIRQFVLSSQKDCTIDELDQYKKILFHDCATMSGDSGGPVLKLENGNLSIIAITSGITIRNKMTKSFATPVSNIDLEFK